MGARPNVQARSGPSKIRQTGTFFYAECDAVIIRLNAKVNINEALAMLERIPKYHLGLVTTANGLAIRVKKEFHLLAQANLDQEYANLVGKELMLTQPTEHNKYLIKGLPRHTTFTEVVQAMQTTTNTIGAWQCKPLHYVNTQDRNTTDMMVLATTTPGGKKDPHFAWGEKWIRIVKHVRVPSPNAWSNNLAEHAQATEQMTSSLHRKPAGDLWAEADDADMEWGPNPWGPANAEHWSRLTGQPVANDWSQSGATADKAWPSDGSGRS